MKKSLFWVIITLIGLSCSTYYHTPDPGRFLVSDSLLRDTLHTVKQVQTGGQTMYFAEDIVKIGDTVISTSYTLDSSFFNVIYYVKKPGYLQLYSEFYAFDMNLLFFDIKKDIVFGLNPDKTGYMHIKKVLDAPQFYQKVVARSIGSAMDTITFKDTVIAVLRVDVKQRFVHKDKNSGEVTRSRQILHFYFYPGAGQIMTIGEDYTEVNLKFNPSEYKNF